MYSFKDQLGKQTLALCPILAIDKCTGRCASFQQPWLVSGLYEYIYFIPEQKYMCHDTDKQILV